MRKANSAVELSVDDRQALALHVCIATLMRKFKLEPGLLAGSVYADLHATDVTLFEMLAEPVDWSVHKIAVALGVRDSTISSALDRLEGRGLVERRRIPSDRRVVRIGLTAQGVELAQRLHKAHVENCRAMLASLAEGDREEFLRMVARVAGG